MKLNKQTGNVAKKNSEDCYVFVKSKRKDEYIKLLDKVKNILSSSPDCINPIGQLIDYKIFNKLNESQKQNYVLRLAATYREICSVLKL